MQRQMEMQSRMDEERDRRNDFQQMMQMMMLSLMPKNKDMNTNMSLFGFGTMENDKKCKMNNEVNDENEKKQCLHEDERGTEEINRNETEGNPKDDKNYE